MTRYSRNLGSHGPLATHMGQDISSTLVGPDHQARIKKNLCQILLHVHDVTNELENFARTSQHEC